MSTISHAQEGAIRRAVVANLDKLEVRQAGNGEDYTITGHAAVFNSWSEDLWTFAGTFREQIAPGAFAGVLASKPDVRLLFNHDGMALARTKSNTLELSEDEEGLRIWARIAPTGLGNDLRTAMQRGDVDQMSFAFTIGEDEWHEDQATEEVERTILRIDELFDVSVVTFPAYPDTDAAVREIRAAANAGLVHPQPVAQPETDAAGDAESRDKDEAEVLPVADGEEHSSAPAEIDPVVGEAEALADMQRSVRDQAREERENVLRLLKETRDGPH